MAPWGQGRCVGGRCTLERMKGAYAASKTMIEPRSLAHVTSFVSCSFVAAAPVGLFGEQKYTTSARSAFSRSGKKPFSGPHLARFGAGVGAGAGAGVGGWRMLAHAAMWHW